MYIYFTSLYFEIIIIVIVIVTVTVTVIIIIIMIRINKVKVKPKSVMEKHLMHILMYVQAEEPNVSL